ncbi:MAG: threonine--tRNA ligase [Methanoculleaceae archaeon]
MRLLLIHSDLISYEAKERTPVAEERAILSDTMEDALVAFCAVESADEEDLDGVITRAAGEISGTASRLGTTRIMLYPYAHLSSDLSSPAVAIRTLEGIEESLSKSGEFEVKRAPFGWYKAFKLKCKGHPLSELSRTILPEEEKEKVVEKKVVGREFFVLTPEGERLDPRECIDDTPFGCLVSREIGCAVAGGEGAEPVHVALMKEKELVGYEPRSDVGHLRWLPKGKIIRDLISDYVLRKVLEYGAMPVETPVMYDLGDRAVHEHAERFGERQYRFRSGTRDMMLRFAACFGMFSIMHDMFISPNTLPLKMYELSTYSFRHEQRGECIGLKRLRAFTMPDMHTLCRDMYEALRCFEEQLAMGWQSGRDLETTLVGVFRCTRDFYEQYADWIRGLVRAGGSPMLIELLDERVHYWVAKVDLAAIDGQGRPIECPTVQIDVESAGRFDISYRSGDGEVHPPILHCSPTGSIERVICALLENTATQDVPLLPTWLSPTQVRLVPVADRHIPFAEEVASQLTGSGIRVDIDDREERINRKVREAGREWIPYVAVIGDREVESGVLTVTVRRQSSPGKPHRETLSPEDLIAKVRAETASMPNRPLYTPRHLSRRPRFT